ncbi:beta-1,3-galactosyl-O-glycosyl-glycoprotein beta-1,6-N-acetylglucosaminyltransferase 7 [Microcaecilia unicolor]|uniref:Beta-1,3-galactosyl-O-glycosyl-glycoprotein beta-1,6-N-acetylglucosaminyltransferase 7-like n=1 Tax=Microcaecilia unicolor TaxID=1415580 RepID=A0A6P7YV47_9AMPH|nr:beta-1,3-galactosyl-O-glycosyl-glycoprotein beta-1,6-N-acetylglucosaminyltransferase 7-like [Microcaecilia unicolor]XP_030068502.1 beta-1,3-galactosyl-O-glycosyl-glycoprotein beta-1,6-N-acetylglucosaminyltransferase 7-like [Microcaecilia unicolor]
MTQLDAVKSGFILCLGICIFICTFIYINSSAPKEPTEQSFLPNVLECGFYPDELCSALFRGVTAAPVIGNFCQQAIPKGAKQVPNLLQNPGNCSRMVKELHIITKALSEEEATFSLAYIVTIHKELEMFVKLFRAIYAPQNVYCIHIDEKSSKTYKNAVQSLVNCFQNVFIASKRENVVYAGFSRLQADINCMKDLLRSKIQWKYIINLCGQDYPIKTNREIIRYLKSKWNGKNITPGVIQPAHIKHRTRVSYKEFVNVGVSYVYPTTNVKDGPPHNLTIYFGTAYYALTRKFAEFALTDENAKDLLQWSKDTYSPDEHYWVTLNRLKDAPGATPDAQWEGHVRAIKWRDQEGHSHSGCKGHYIRDICVYGLGDLQWIIESPHLFANKFEFSKYPLVIECLERRFRLKVLQQAEVPLEAHWHFQQDNYFNLKLNV